MKAKKRKGEYVSPERVLSVPEVCELVGISRATLQRWERTGHFPARRQLGPQRIGWLLSEYNAWLESRPPARGPVEGVAKASS
jgi:prophage regulatory protein